MSIPAGGDIGLEAHPETDQFLRLDAGRGRVQTGAAKNKLTFEKEVSDGWCVLVPAGTWHNITNIGATPMQVYAIYAPAHHTPGKVQATVSAADLEVMRRLDRLHLEYPFAGSRMLRGLLAAEGSKIGRRHVKTLMRRMGIEALCRRPRTTKPPPPSTPYLLRGMEITRSNQVWAMDITYIPMARGFVYLAAVVDWFSRRVLAWRLSITHGGGVLRRGTGGSSVALRHAGDLQHRPGRQFTSAEFTGALLANGIAISMDGKGAWRDNVFVERLWRTIKYEEVYLRAYDTVSDARGSLGRYIAFYNSRRPHQVLTGNRRIGRTSTGRRYSRRPNPGRGST